MSKELTTEQKLMQATQYGLLIYAGQRKIHDEDERLKLEKIANEIYDEMSSFASYAFNKSHAACYAYVAFQTAYLKCHYPSQFMACLLYTSPSPRDA